MVIYLVVASHSLQKLSVNAIHSTNTLAMLVASKDWSRNTEKENRPVIGVYVAIGQRA